MQDLHLKLTDWLPLLPLALLLYVARIPGLGFINIDVLALFVILFSLYRQRGFPLLMAFAIGLLQDIVSLAPLGQHAIGLAVLAYVSQSFRDQVRMQSLIKQIPAIFVGLLMVKFIHSWVVALGFGQLPTLDSFLTVIVTTACWPLLVQGVYLAVRDRNIRHSGFG